MEKNEVSTEEILKSYKNLETLRPDDDAKGYFLVSMISPENYLNCNTWGIKIKDFVFSDEEGKKKAEIYRKKDKYFDVYIGHVGHWVPVNPSTSQVEEEKFANDKLDKVMKRVHENEKKKEQENTGNDDYDERQIIKDIENRIDKNEEENEDILEQTNFLYNDVDCLDEDAVISDKRFAVLSFATPELILGLKDRFMKVKKYTNSYNNALLIAKELEKKDPRLNVGIVEIGKWNAINFKSMGRKQQVTQQDLNNLNEIVGRHKKYVDSRKDDLEKYKMEQINKCASELNNEPQNKEQSLADKKEDELEHEQKIKDLNKNKECAKERLRKLIEQKKSKQNINTEIETKIEEKQNAENENNTKKENNEQKKIDYSKLNRNRESTLERMKKKLEENKNKNKKELQEKEVRMKQETVRITEKKNDLESIKADKDKIEANLAKMKELYAKKWK